MADRKNRMGLLLTVAASALFGALCAAPMAMADAPVQATSGSAKTAATNPHIKYKAGKEIDFEQLLIEGQIRRPEISVITGDSGQGTDGLLRLRKDFLDRMAVDMAEDVK